MAREIIAETDVSDGYCLVLGLKDGELIREMVTQTDLTVIGVDEDQGKVGLLRQRFVDAGLYGSRVELFVAKPFSFPFPPYLASLILSEDIHATGFPGSAEAVPCFNTLRPYGGTLCLDLSPDQRKQFTIWAAKAGAPNAVTRQQGRWSLLVREGALPGAAPWTHEAADAGRTFCSRDERVKAPLGVLWYGDMNRFTQVNDYGVGVKPQVVGGRVFGLRKQKNRAVLFAYDAYTGRFLWKNEIPCLRAHARFSAQLDGVYVIADGTCIVYEPDTGNVQHTSTYTAEGEGVTVAKDIRVDGDVVLVACDAMTESEMGGTYFQVLTFSGQAYFNSSTLVCLDRRTGSELWRRQAKDRFCNTGIAMGAGRVFCVDSLPMRSAGKLQRRTDGIVECESTLFVLAPRTGAVLWSATSCTQYVEKGGDDWVAYSPDTGVFLWGRQATLKAFKATTGEPLWEKSGLGSRPYIVRRGTFIAQAGWDPSYTTYDLATGEKTGREAVHRPYWGGCNYGIGSENLTFRRLGSVYYRDEEQDRDYHLRAIRSGCSNSLIPADGLVNAPNYSSGCVCNYALQTSFAMVHMPDVIDWDGGTPYPVPPPPTVPQRGACLKLGPLAQGLVDIHKVVEKLKAGDLLTQPWVLEDESFLAWTDSAKQSSWYDVVLWKTPIIGGEPQLCVLQTDVLSNKEQTLEFKAFSPAPGNAVDMAAYLNGASLTTPGQVVLRMGTNRLLVFYWGRDTALLQFLKPGTLQRADDICFRLPAVTPPDATPYRPPAKGPVKGKSLAGLWRAHLVRKLSPTPAGPPNDGGIGDETKKLLGADADDGAWKPVRVPSHWESYGGEWAGANGEAVFRRTVNIPPEWADKDLVLSLGAIDDFDDTFWNGTLVGRTDISVPNSWSVTRRYRVPGSLVRTGPATIAVRVFDHGGGGGMAGRAEDFSVSLAP